MSRIDTVRGYLRDRLADPVSWLALSFMGAWAMSAVFGIAPFAVISIICIVFALGEWLAILAWWKKGRQVKKLAYQLSPALDRWKVGALILLGVTTFVLDLWVGSKTQSHLSIGLSIFGISSLIMLWYAWTRPVLVGQAGIVVGVTTVPWNDVRSITTDPSGGKLRIDFSTPNYFYGTKVVVRTNDDDVAKMKNMIPGHVEVFDHAIGPRPQTA